MRYLIALVVSVSLAGCGGGGGSSEVALASAGGVCPDADPVRDGPFVDAIRTRDRAMIDRALGRNASDPRAIAAQAIVEGRGDVDPDQAACFAPYL